MLCDLLLVTSFNNLRSRYGPDDVGSVAAAVEGYIDRVERQGRKAELLDIAGATTDSSWQQIKKRISDHGGLKSDSCVLILGNHDIVPFCELPIEDEVTLSDSWYVDFKEGKDHTPYCAVGRLPDAGDIENFNSQLSQFPGAPTHSGQVPHQFGLASEVWAGPSQLVYKQLDPTLQSLTYSPPTGTRRGKHTSVRLEGKHLDGKGILYFNVHGEQDSSSWYGERRRSLLGTWLTSSVYVEAIDAATISRSRLDQAAVITTACYSTDTRLRDHRNSVALALLRQGASVVIGPSSNAYGYLLRRGVPSGLSGIDLLCHMLFQHLLAGRSAGDSLLMTKRLFAASNIYDDLNVLGLNLLGDPYFSVLSQRLGR